MSTENINKTIKPLMQGHNSKSRLIYLSLQALLWYESPSDMSYILWIIFYLVKLRANLSFLFSRIVVFNFLRELCCTKCNKLFLKKYLDSVNFFLK